MTTIIIPGDHFLVEATQVIPAIENMLGRHWRQPLRGDISIEIKPDPDSPVGAGDPLTGVPGKYTVIHAYMTQHVMNDLAEYSSSTPSGVYPGKMWKGHWQDAWHLCWYGESDQPGMCSTNHCPILLTDILDLLNPDGKASPIPF